MLLIRNGNLCGYIIGYISMGGYIIGGLRTAIGMTKTTIPPMRTTIPMWAVPLMVIMFEHVLQNLAGFFTMSIRFVQFVVIHHCVARILKHRIRRRHWVRRSHWVHRRHYVFHKIHSFFMFGCTWVLYDRLSTLELSYLPKNPCFDEGRDSNPSDYASTITTRLGLSLSLKSPKRRVTPSISFLRVAGWGQNVWSGVRIPRNPPVFFCLSHLSIHEGDR